MTLDGAGPGRATEVRCRHCGDRVLAVHADRGKARTAIALHLIKQHEDQLTDESLILENRDFLCGPAPLRCDLCMAIAEPPFWTYTTGPGLAVEDPEWLVCDGCHGVLSSQPKPLRMLVERSFQEQMSGFILDSLPEREIRQHLKDTIRGFLDHQLGGPVRS